MASFDTHFAPDLSKTVASDQVTFQGEHYRITVLTERLVRLEFNKDGIFCDDLTEQVLNRNFPVPQFKVVEDTRYLEITTKYLEDTSTLSQGTGKNSDIYSDIRTHVYQVLQQ